VVIDFIRVQQISISNRNPVFVTNYVTTCFGREDELVGFCEHSNETWEYLYQINDIRFSRNTLLLGVSTNFTHNWSYAIQIPKGSGNPNATLRQV
jgi:hypothetical protein